MIEDADSQSPRAAPEFHSVEDCELLRRYADHGSEDAFAELVRRRIGLVYSVALRQVRGDRHRAEDATQAVFTDLARKASALARRPVLAGWLYRSAQFAAAGLLRAEQRRRAREQEAHSMETILPNDSPPADWDKVRPVLDRALNEIDERDRDAIVLRFFDGRPFAEIGGRLRFTESAARMRVERALDKLNVSLSRRGITSTTAALAAALGQQVGATTPAGLAATVTGTALAGTAATASGWIATFMSISKLQVGIAGAVAATGVTGYVLQAGTNADLRREIAALQEPQQAVARLRAENQQLARLAVEVESLRRDDAEYARLAQSIADAQKVNAENARLARQREREASIKAEIDRMNKEGSALVEEYKALTTQTKDAALTAEDRARAEAATKAKMAEIQAKQREVQALKASSGTAFQKGEVNKERWTYQKGEPNREQWTPVDNEHVSLRIPQADHTAVLSVYERTAEKKIIRDPSIDGIQTIVDLQTPPSTRAELTRNLRDALRDQFNIILEPGADGSLVAKLGPPR